jgi:hypothetical protein
MPKTHAVLNGISGLDDKYLNLMFMDFFKTLLPMEDVLRIMDAYLLEVRRKVFLNGIFFLIFCCYSVLRNVPVMIKI